MLGDVLGDAPTWAERCDKGRTAEEIIGPMFLKAGWCILSFGATRAGSPVPPLLTPTGTIRPVDFACWHPDGRRLYAVEVKSKTEMTYLAGYGLDRAEGDADPWFQLQQHDERAGPVLLVIWDPVKRIALAATVPMLRANGGPNMTRGGSHWWWRTDVFCRLETFLAM